MSDEIKEVNQGPEGGSSEENPGNASSGRSWTPNKVRKVRSKKSFDEKKVAHLVNDEKPVYRGELDPRQKDPDRKPRSISRSEEKVMAKAEKLAENDPVVASMRKKDHFTDFRDQFESCKASPGRLAALYATQRVRRRKAFAQEVIEATIDQSRLSAQDKAFSTLLTLGVVSTVGSLDEVINRCLQSPRDIQPDVRDALRISAYEVIYLRKEPHAAVDQGVELVRAVAPSASGLGNAVLHRILESSDAFPFGDPAKSLEALALLHAFPIWLARKLIEDMGPEAANDFMRASNEPAPLFIHVNSLKSSDDEVISLFADVGAELSAGESGGIAAPGCYRVSNTRALADGRIQHLFQQGKILVSDASAQAIAASVLENGLPENMLEVGAGRGTKTILLQSIAKRLFGKQIKLTSMDSHSFKTDLLSQRAKLYGARIDSVVTGNATRLDSVMPGRDFDVVFIDAPCSGLGTLRRHQDIRWRLESEKIGELAQTGIDLLSSASGHVASSGSIVYATCTVVYEENYGVVKRFLESTQGSNFKLAPLNGKACFASQLSGNSPDAHFAARFVRVQ